MLDIVELQLAATRGSSELQCRRGWKMGKCSLLSLEAVVSFRARLFEIMAL